MVDIEHEFGKFIARCRDLASAPAQNKQVEAGRPIPHFDIIKTLQYAIVCLFMLAIELWQSKSMSPNHATVSRPSPSIHVRSLANVKTT